jgi:hypothetical protein
MSIRHIRIPAMANDNTYVLSAPKLLGGFGAHVQRIHLIVQMTFMPHVQIAEITTNLIILE